ncbi:MAG: magnesium/cobalt transporter CorA [Treponema sp.]|jgi:magnesium transporter|nr:magnesium/cobalt transporter CorA [Treponema sp.]
MARHKKRPDIGLPPGSPVYVGDRNPSEMALSIIGYDPVGAWVKTADTVEELLGYRNTGGITWINVNGLKDSGAISQLAQFYRIHPLTVEDILNTGHRPKVEEFGDYLFITFKAIRYKAEDGDRYEYEQISLICTIDTIITFQEIPGDSFDGIRRRILNNMGKIRKLGADYLAYAIMDSVVDNYFLVLDALGSALEEFEERAIDESGNTFIAGIQRAKQNLFQIRRAVWPLRESLSFLVRLDSPLVSDELEPFLKDLQGNVIQAAETVESCRELLAGVMEVNLSSVSNRMNNVMKVLTIISTIFIPLTFIAGVYGMNFSYMPELGTRYGYFITWGVMLLIAGGMVLFFKKRRWI